jgi:hypothetical protein
MECFERRVVQFVFTLVFSFFSFKGVSQLKNIKLFLEAGAAIPANKDLNNVFTAGVNGAIGPVISVLDEKLSIQPLGGMKWYFKQVKEENSLTEHFRTWKAGVSVSYTVVGFKGIQLSPLLRLDYNWSSNYYSETYDYNVYNGMSSIALSDKYLKGNGISYDIGMKIQRPNWYLKIDHEFFKPTLTVNEKLRSEAWNQGFFIPENYTYNLNSFNLTIGYQIIPVR